jgi:hypothetical protein
LDPVSETCLISLIKLIGSTKKLIHTAGALAVVNLLVSCTLRPRLLDRIVAGIEDKNTQVRSYCSLFLYEVILHFKETMDEYHTDVARHFLWDYAEKGIKKGVKDSNPQVREVCRDCFWVFSEINNIRAQGYVHFGIS